LAYFKYKEKKVFYDTVGTGEPLLLIHSNALSSKMWEPVIQYYENNFKVILVDLPGYGKSERLPKFPKDLWFENSLCLYELLQHLGMDNINVIGASGGAITAFNLLLEHPECVKALIADSFMGIESTPEFAADIHVKRNNQKKNLSMKLEWFNNHGFDWKRVVEQDSDAIYAHYMEIKKFFHKDLSVIEKPVLLTGSLADPILKDRIVDLYAEIKSKIPLCQSHYFHEGGHPSMISNGEEFANIAIKFFKS